LRKSLPFEFSGRNHAVIEPGYRYAPVRSFEAGENRRQPPGRTRHEVAPIPRVKICRGSSYRQAQLERSTHTENDFRTLLEACWSIGCHAHQCPLQPGPHLLHECRHLRAPHLLLPVENQLESDGNLTKHASESSDGEEVTEELALVIGAAPPV